MKRKRSKKKAERLSERLLMRLFLIGIKIFPETALYSFSQIFAGVTFLLAQKSRNLTIENLTSAFKNEKSSKEIKKIARQVFCGIALDGVETAILLLKKADINKILMENISVEGAEYLDEALKNKKSVICIGAHFGNFMLMAAKLSLMGYPYNMIVKDRGNPLGAESWEDIRRKAGIKSIPARPRIKAVSESLRWLKNGGILLLYADHYRKGGVYIDFFNRPAASVRGPAMFHLRTGSVILCAFIIRLDRTKHKIVITPRINVKKTGNREEDVYQITKAYTNIIEDFVRRYPEQWWWSHDRWKKNR